VRSNAFNRGKIGERDFVRLETLAEIIPQVAQPPGVQLRLAAQLIQSRQIENTGPLCHTMCRNQVFRGSESLHS
jgi:hypothetical protein